MGIFERQPLQVHGEVAAGYEKVRQQFTDHMQRYAETCAQLCVYKGGDKVVDLWAAPVDNKSFSGDSLINVFSSGKSLEAIVVAMLHDRALISYDAKVADYWPAYGQKGKETTTIADVMRHEAGLAAFNFSIEPDDLLTENIKQNRIGIQIEEHPQMYRNPNSSREYHALTRGWVINEIVRRVDPQGRTMGQILRQEIQEPMGLDVFVGLKQQELDRRSPLVPIEPGRHLRESMKPTFMRRGVQHNFAQLMTNLVPAFMRMRKSAGSGPDGPLPAPFVGMDGFDFFNRKSTAMGETSSANAHCTARGLARLASILACRGESGADRLFGDDTWAAMHANPKQADMGMITTFTQGGVATFGELSDKPGSFEIALNTGRDGFVGWMGLGGSVFQWNPERQLGFSFVPTRLHVLDLVNERGKALQKAVLDCQ